MTTGREPPDQPEPMTLTELRELVEQTIRATAENAHAIAKMSEVEQARAAQHDREMAGIRALQVENTRAIAQLNAAQQQTTERLADLTEAINRLRSEQNRTSNDVSTLKGWALANLCERHPELFADRLELRSVEIVPAATIIEIANAAHQHGIITQGQRANVLSADVYFYGRRAFDDTPVCLLVQISFAVKSVTFKGRLTRPAFWGRSFRNTSLVISMAAFFRWYPELKLMLMLRNLHLLLASPTFRSITAIS